MTVVWYWLYNLLVLPCLWTLLYGLSYVQPKAGRLVRQRRRDMREFQDRLARLPAGARRIGIHCASMGEWEQAQPLIEALRRRDSDVQFVVSFFSTSGYGQFTPDGDTMVGGYLPLDFSRAARWYFDVTRPDLWIIVKHDIWPNHVRACARAGIPVVLIDANLHPGSRRLWPVARGFYRAVFRHVETILAVSEEDAARFRTLCGTDANIIAVGDTRFDRVETRSHEYQPAAHDVLPPHDGPVLVVGSTWPADDAHLIPAVARLLTDVPALRVVWVPHEPDANHLSVLERSLARHGLKGNGAATRRSTADGGKAARVVIVDRVGMLAHIYRAATVAYVGGSFGSGVHNVMEPAILEKPVLFGPHYRNSFEAQQLVCRGGGMAVQTSEDIHARVLHWLRTPAERHRAGVAARNVMLTHLGATERIVGHMERLGLC